MITCQDEPSGRIGFPWGTPLYNAPETRKGIKVGNDSFTIDDAMLTDIFSFGLALWEVLKHGHSYTQGIQTVHQAPAQADCGITAEHLNDLTLDSLLDLALNSVNNMELDLESHERAEIVLRGSLRDDPEQRISMGLLSKALDWRKPLTK